MLAELACGGALRPRIAAGYPLSDIHDAQAEFRRGAHIGKIVITP